MNQSVFILFAIPILCIVVVAFSQFGDEMFKKKFVIERRKRAADARNDASGNRRYNDPKVPGAQPETISQQSTTEKTPNLETSGLRN
jgi:hypothetical protein